VSRNNGITTSLTRPPRTYASILQAGGDALLDEIKAMRVKQLKEELVKIGVSTQDAFEKEELVQRLYQAKSAKGATVASPPGPQNNGFGSSPQQPPPQQQPQNVAAAAPAAWSQQTPPPPPPPSKNQIIIAPLYLTSLETGTRVAAVNGHDITVEAKDHPYPSIKIQVTPAPGKPECTLNLLLDTACSGIVLRPSVVKQYKLPELSTPVTMTGAGGVASNTGLTQLDKCRLEQSTFGPLPAAVQEIGALPSTLDGIIGLSFLNQFAGAELDFRRGKLFLFPRGQLPELPSELEIVAEGDMELLSKLGIYVVDTYLGGRGPVKMLVDTGASDSFMNWKGVEEGLGIGRDSKFLASLPSPMGAVGSDAIAMELTHRINISSNLNFGQRLKPGLSLADQRRLSVDIGNIAILDSLRDDGVGGILGIDAFMKCDSVRMTFQGMRTIQFLLAKKDWVPPPNPQQSQQQQQPAPPQPRSQQPPTTQPRSQQPPRPNAGTQPQQPTSQRAEARARRSVMDPSATGVQNGMGGVGRGTGAPPAVDLGVATPPPPRRSGQPGPNQSTHSDVRGDGKPKPGDYMNDFIIPVDDGSGGGFQSRFGNA